MTDAYRGDLDEIHVVNVNLLAQCTDASALGVEEKNKANRFVFNEHRRRFVAAHLGLRRIVAHFAQLNVTALQFSANPYGKPRLNEVSADVRFNLSHSGERALVALAVGREIGVDIEQHRSLDYLALAKNVFSEIELVELRNVPPCNRRTAFYRGWTRKESFIKARGEGLSCDLRSFDVSLAASAPSLLLGCRPDTNEVSRWTMIGLDVGNGYEAALTVEGSNWSLVYWDDIEQFVSAPR